MESDTVRIANQQVGGTGRGGCTDNVRRTIGQQLNQHEVVKVKCKRSDQQRSQRLHQQWNSDLEEVLDRTSTIHCRCFIQIFRDRLQQAHTQNDHVWIAQPGVDDQDHGLCQDRAGVPLRLLETKHVKEHVDFTEVLVEQALEHQDGDKRWYRIRQNQHDTIETATTQLFPLHQTSQHHTDSQSEAHRTRGKNHSPYKDLQEWSLNARVGHYAQEVLPADVDHETRSEAFTNKNILVIHVLEVTSFHIRKHDLTSFVIT